MTTTEKKGDHSFTRELGIFVCIIGTMIALTSWMGEQFGYPYYQSLFSISTTLLGITLNLFGVALIVYARTRSEATKKSVEKRTGGAEKGG